MKRNHFSIFTQRVSIYLAMSHTLFFDICSIHVSYLITLQLLSVIMKQWWRLNVFKVPSSRHSPKQVSEVCSHMYWKFPHNRRPLIQSSCFVSWCHKRDRKYPPPFQQHLAVRNSQRYDLTSWSSRPLWWNAVIQEICEVRSAWTLQTLFPYGLCVRMCLAARLCGKVSVSLLLQSLLCLPIV